MKGFSYILLLFIQTLTYSQNYIYKQSFETNNPFIFWTANAAYTINYFGISNEIVSEGSYSLKMDITINGSADKEYYYYWKLPVKTNLHGVLDFSADLWMDSISSKYVKLGYHYGFPPTNIERTPIAAGIPEVKKWYTQSCRLSDDVIYHADYFSRTKIYGSTYQDFGRELQFIQLSIKGKGFRRLIFYIDNIQISGNIMNNQEFIDYYNANWSAFQTKLSVIRQEKHAQFNSLPDITDTSGIKLSDAALIYYNQLIELRKELLTLFNTIDNSEFFDTVIMDSLNYKLNIFPSVILMLNNEISNSSNILNVFTFPSTVYNRLDENNLPSGLSSFDNLVIRMCKGEYEPFSLLLQAKNRIDKVKVRWTDFTGQSGNIDSSAMDVSIAKVWYQAGIAENEINNKLLTQELLIKNDDLIKVDKSTGTNYLQVRKADGSLAYTDISTPSAVFPSNVTVEDSKVLLPFSIEANSNKQLWFTLKMPENIIPGIYSAMVQIYDENVIYRTFTLQVEVLPFNLDASRLIYGIYYNGYLDNYLNKPFHFTNKTESQLRIELLDMKQHGILYPTTYQVFANLDGDLKIRNEVGLPNDKLFAAGFKAGNPQSSSELSELKLQIAEWKSKISLYGYRDLYLYGIDEAHGELLRSQKPAWQAVQQSGANIFVAGYNDLIVEMKDLIDAGIVFGEHTYEQPKLYHEVGKYIFSYSNPQAGHENPEIYRRNFGLALWKAGYDGAMDYAYQKNYGSTWNDFDGTKYRDQNFTYPVTNGIISTIQWEGFREGIDDVKYISTLLNRIDHLKSSGIDVSSIEEWINSIDPSKDLNKLRDDIIDKLLLVTDISLPVIKSPEITDVSFIDSTLIKIRFNKCLNSVTISPDNIIIEPALQIYGLKLSTDLKTIYAKTSPHRSFIKYNIAINKVIDVYESPIVKNSYDYTYNTLRVNIKVYLQGPFVNGTMKPISNNLIPLSQPFNIAPWNYNGNEKMEYVPGDIVDWVLVDFRSDANTILYTKAALLKTDGQLVDPDQSEWLNLYNLEPGYFYISIRHRNHLGIISSMKKYISASPDLIDLTLNSNVDIKCSMAKLNEFSYGLLSGDCDANGKVEILDFRMIKNKLNASGYFSGDLNLDGIVTESDLAIAKKSLFRYSVLD